MYLIAVISTLELKILKASIKNNFLLTILTLSALMLCQTFAIRLIHREELAAIHINLHNKIASDKINFLYKFTHKPGDSIATTTAKSTIVISTTSTTTATTTTAATTPIPALPTTALITQNTELYNPHLVVSLQQVSQDYLPQPPQYSQMSLGGICPPMLEKFPIYPEVPSFYPPAPHPHYQ